MGESSFGSVAMVTMGTNTEGKKKKKGGSWLRPCITYGVQHKLKECPEWKWI